MAAVYLARDPLLTRHVAVKLLHREVARNQVALKRFFNEAKTIANVRNPHVVEVFDFGREGRDYYLVMEFVDGQSLQGVVRQLEAPERGSGAVRGGAPLPDLVTAALLCQAAEGLDIAARHGVVHRDIKPENLMINTQGYLKIADFGIAHLQDETLTRTGAVLGSPLFMSPEQVRGTKPITSQSDMFSLGAVLYRCLTGAPPFAASSLKDLYRSIAQESHVPILHRRPNLDPALARVGEILLAKAPEARGGGPRWLRTELRAWLMHRGVADPMDLVAAHLRDLAGRGVRTTWLGGGVDSTIPRTVAASRPVSSRGSAHSAATRPVHPSRSAAVQETVPMSHSARTRRGPGRGILVVALATLLLAAAGYGVYRFHPSPGGARGSGDPAPRGGQMDEAHLPSGAEKHPVAVGGTRADGADQPDMDPAGDLAGPDVVEEGGAVRLR
ncbi:MAG TPA: serine/threonine-protein kinase, partial [Fibrobacteria bacterium]|nr:serine/threonine-protein kinase [Fibrobacteria bacterium]